MSNPGLCPSSILSSPRVYSVIPLPLLSPLTPPHGSWILRLSSSQASSCATSFSSGRFGRDGLFAASYSCGARTLLSSDVSSYLVNQQWFRHEGSNPPPPSHFSLSFSFSVFLSVFSSLPLPPSLSL